MLAAAPAIDVWQQHTFPRDRVREEPVDFPLVSSGDPTFASRTDEILKSMNTERNGE